jgi:hypothetical protein
MAAPEIVTREEFEAWKATLPDQMLSALLNPHGAAPRTVTREELHQAADRIPEDQIAHAIRNLEFLSALKLHSKSGE